MIAPTRTGCLSLWALVGLVVANMVGTGVFTGLGYQLVTLRSGFVILALWGLGGLCSLCGALCYAELGTALPRSGGEYHFLSRIYARPVGFLAGWVSITAGFAAPVALAAMALGSYTHRLLPALPPLAMAQGVLVITTLLHLAVPRVGMACQNGFTILKVGIVLLFIGAGCLAAPHGDASFRFTAEALPLMGSSHFAIALVFVMYAYSGWNASVYIASDAENPAVNLPRSVIMGTVLVTVLYVGLNWAFLRNTPMHHLAGRTDAALVAADLMLGPRFGPWAGGAMALVLVSSISAMVWIGPRVIRVMGEDHPLFGWLGTASATGVPVWAMVLQSSLSMLLIWSGTYERVLIYAQFSLLLCTFLAAAGVVVLRFTEPDLPRTYRTWGYPLTPILFAGVTLWMLGYVVRFRPMESLMGLATVVSGLLVYAASQRGAPLAGKATSPTP